MLTTNEALTLLAWFFPAPVAQALSTANVPEDANAPNIKVIMGITLGVLGLMAILFWSLVIFGAIRGCARATPPDIENTQLTDNPTAPQGRPPRAEVEQSLQSASPPASQTASGSASVATLPRYVITPHDIPPSYESTNEGGSGDGSGCGAGSNVCSSGRGGGGGDGGGGGGF